MKRPSMRRPTFVKADVAASGLGPFRYHQSGSCSCFAEDRAIVQSSRLASIRTLINRFSVGWVHDGVRPVETLQSIRRPRFVISREIHVDPGSFRSRLDRARGTRIPIGSSVCRSCFSFSRFPVLRRGFEASRFDQAAGSAAFGEALSPCRDS